MFTTTSTPIPPCYNLQYFDDSTKRRPYPYEDSVPQGWFLQPGQFIAPAGTHCDLISESSLEPGVRAVLLVWGQRRCKVDVWGCLESVQVDPGSYRIEGRFSLEPGVVGPGQAETTDATTTTAEWGTVIAEGQK